MSGSVWNEGAAAARVGSTNPVGDCPYPTSSWDSVVWMNGWSTARHNMAVEAAKCEKKLDPHIKVRHLTAEPCSGDVITVTPVDDDLFGDDNADLF